MNNKIKSILEVLIYILGGIVFGILFIAAIMAIMYILSKVAILFASITIIKNVVDVIFAVLCLASVFLIGLALFTWFIDWLNRKLNK